MKQTQIEMTLISNIVCTECGISNGHYRTCKVLQYGETEMEKLVRIEGKIDKLLNQLQKQDEKNNND